MRDKKNKSEGMKEDKDKTPIKFSRKEKVKRLKERKRRKGSRKKKIVLSVLAVFFVLAGFFGYKGWSILSQIFEGGISAPGLLGDLTANQLKGEGSGRVNILLLGMGGSDHPGGLLSDTNIVMSIDPRKADVAMLSIPRDLYVNVPGYGYRRINEAYSIGESRDYEGGGPALAKETVSRTLDIPIHYYARVDFDGFEKIVDEVGGIDIYVEEDIYDPYYPNEGMSGSSTYSIDAGQHHMDGAAALRYARSRKTTSDFDRAARQQKVIIGVKDKIFSSGVAFNPKKILSIVSILGDHVKTDLGVKDMKRLYEISKKIDSSNIITKVLDNKETGLLMGANVGGASVLKTTSGDWDDVRDFVKNIFADSYIKDENATIDIVDASTTYNLGEIVEKTLKNLHYNITNVEEADDTKETTRIYDYSRGDNPYTVKYLSDRFDVSVEERTRGEDEKGVDIKIILGKDYKG